MVMGASYLTDIINCQTRKENPSQTQSDFGVNFHVVLPLDSLTAPPAPKPNLYVTIPDHGLEPNVRRRPSRAGLHILKISGQVKYGSLELLPGKRVPFPRKPSGQLPSR